MSGFVAMHRGWQDHDIFGNDEFSRRDAWAWLITHAAWKPTKVRIKGKAVVLERGDLCFSQRFLAEKWGWSKSRVDRFIALLRDEGMIETRSKIGATAGHSAGQGQAIITVCNYDRFQTPLKDERGSPQDEIGATAGQQRGKEEQGNKIIPLSNDNGDVAFWASAKSYVGQFSKSPGPLIGKWLRDHGKDETAKAITAAQVENAVNGIEYIEGVFRRHSPRYRPAIPI